MGKILVIAEKPKTAKLLREGLSPSQPNISFVRCGTSAIGAAQVGYYENDNVIIAYLMPYLTTRKQTLVMFFQTRRDLYRRLLMRL